MINKITLRVAAALLAWAVVAWGQPDVSTVCCLFAATCGYALFWWAVHDVEGKWARGIAGTLWYCGVQLVQLGWMTAYEFQGYYILGVYAALTVLIGIQFGCLTAWIRSPSLARCAAGAAWWAVLEWLRLQLLCGWSWGPAGLPLAATILSLQWVTLFGVLGLSFLVLYTNLLGYRAWLTRQWSYYALLVAIPWLWGAVQLAAPVDNAQRTLRVALFGSSWSPAQKLLLEGRTEEWLPPLVQWDRLLSSLDVLKDQHVDLILFPESAVVGFLNHCAYPFPQIERLWSEKWPASVPAFPPLKPPYAERDAAGRIWVSSAFLAQSIAQQCNADTVMGFEEREMGEAKLSYRQGAFFFSPHCADGWERYCKRKLIPLAEMLPWEWCRRWSARYGIHDFYDPGKSAVHFQGAVRMAPLMCYEETFPELAREAHCQGAELLLLMSNDNWFWRSSLGRHHFWQGVLSSVAAGLPSVRSCNAGFCSVVDARGRIVACAQNREECTSMLVATVSLGARTTPYLWWGDSGIVGISLIVLFTEKVMRRKNRKSLLQKSTAAKN